MKITAGHDCAHANCDGLAVFGFTFKGEARWACAAHRQEIGITKRPAADCSIGALAGLQVRGASTLPAAISQPAQARLI